MFKLMGKEIIAILRLNFCLTGTIVYFLSTDQNKCTDSSYVMDVVSRNCSDVVAALESTSDVCK